MNKKGFTLVELLAVLVILALIAIIVSNTVNNTIDKAKSTLTSAQEQSILSAAEMWSVDNSVQFDDIEASKINVGLDVVFVLDITNSMSSSITGTSISRYQAMFETVNDTIVNLLNENDVRIAIVLYNYNTSSQKVEDTIFLPLDRYVASSDTVLKYNGNYTATLSNLTNSSGANINKTSKTPGSSWTYMQYALSLTYHEVFSKVSSADAKERIPAVIFLSDGEPNHYSSNYTSPASSNVTKSTTNSYGFYNGSSDTTALYSILTANYFKMKIDNHYPNSDIIFYTVGLGVAEGSMGEAILNPTKDNIQKFSNLSNNLYNKNYSPLSSLDKNYAYSDAYYGGRHMSIDELKGAFSNFSQTVVEASKVTQVCVTVQDLYDGGYLSKDDIEMADGEAASTYVIMNYNEATNQYNFNLAKTAKQESDCEKLLSQS